MEYVIWIWRKLWLHEILNKNWQNKVDAYLQHSPTSMTEQKNSITDVWLVSKYASGSSSSIFDSEKCSLKWIFFIKKCCHCIAFILHLDYYHILPVAIFSIHPCNVIGAKDGSPTEWWPCESIILGCFVIWFPKVQWF